MTMRNETQPTSVKTQVKQIETLNQIEPRQAELQTRATTSKVRHQTAPKLKHANDVQTPTIMATQ